MYQSRGDFTTKRSSPKEYEALTPIRMPHGGRRSVLQKARGMQRLTAFAILIFGGKLQNFKEDLHSRSSSFCVLQIQTLIKEGVVRQYRMEALRIEEKAAVPIHENALQSRTRMCGLPAKRRAAWGAIRWKDFPPVRRGAWRKFFSVSVILPDAFWNSAERILIDLIGLEGDTSFLTTSF